MHHRAINLCGVRDTSRDSPMQFLHISQRPLRKTQRFSLCLCGFSFCMNQNSRQLVPAKRVAKKTLASAHRGHYSAAAPRLRNATIAFPGLTPRRDICRPIRGLVHCLIPYPRGLRPGLNICRASGAPPQTSWASTGCASGAPVLRCKHSQLGVEIPLTPCPSRGAAKDD